MSPLTTRQLKLDLVRRVLTYRGRVIAAALLLLIAKAAAVAVPLVLKQIVDVFSRPEALTALPVLLLAGYAAVRFAATLFTELRDLVFARVTQASVADLSQRTFEHLHALPARFHADRSTGALARDVERGAAGIGFLTGTALLQLLPTVVEIAAVLGIMVAAYGLEFAGIIGATFLVYALHTAVALRRRAAKQRRVNRLESEAQQKLVDSLLNYETVKSYANEGYESGQLRRIFRRAVDAGVANQLALTHLHIGQSLIIAIGVGAVMLAAGRGIVSGELTVGDLVLVNAYVIQVCLPLNALAFAIREAADALVRAENLFALLALPTEMRSHGERPQPFMPGAVRFEGVSFGYEPSRQILRDVDFTIPVGATVAVVGGSGSGKSTVARLLLKFFEPSKGRVTIAGTDIACIDSRELRAGVGLVAQDTTLFNDTIEYNIGYGRLDASHEQIVAAARAANIHDFIAALPQGYATLVGERGLKLSGGEKQRISIARAILKDPPILVLDEATAALDSRSERAIRGTLEQLAAPRTTLVIAHRLSTVVNANEILVLEAGTVAERGRHSELIERPGLYAGMWALQQQERELRQTKRRARLMALDLAALTGEVIGALQPDIEAKGLNLYTSLTLDGAVVTGDYAALHEVVADLVEHAVHISDTGARIELAVERVGNQLRLRVADTRPTGEEGGAAASTAPDPAPTRHFDPGTLRVTVEEHHGRLLIEPVEPVGTAYVLTLPVRAVAAPVARADPAPAAPELDQVLRGKSVLVVDDDEDAREALGQLLSLQGGEVATYGSGRELLDDLVRRVGAAWPHLLICDIGLPGEDGYRVLKRVRALEAERRIALGGRMAAIALTGFADPEDRVQALLAGFQAHLVKPASARELLATAQRLLTGPGRGESHTGGSNL
jgi:ATP-binding cassette subfamily B protein